MVTTSSDFNSAWERMKFVFYFCMRASPDSAICFRLLSSFESVLDNGKMSIKQNFHAECEAMINKQINMELYASYVYLSMTAFFSR